MAVLGTKIENFGDVSALWQKTETLLICCDVSAGWRFLELKTQAEQNIGGASVVFYNYSKYHQNIKIFFRSAVIKVNGGQRKNK